MSVSDAGLLTIWQVAKAAESLPPVKDASRVVRCLVPFEAALFKMEDHVSPDTPMQFVTTEFSAEMVAYQKPNGESVEAVQWAYRGPWVFIPHNDPTVLIHPGAMGPVLEAFRREHFRQGRDRKLSNLERIGVTDRAHAALWQEMGFDKKARPATFRCDRVEVFIDPQGWNFYWSQK